MPLQCCVLNCKTNNKHVTPGYTTLFKFPKSPIERIKWIENIGRPNWKPNLDSALCSRHFASDCIIKKKSKNNNNNNNINMSNEIVKLKTGACPTIFPTHFVRNPQPNINRRNVLQCSDMEINNSSDKSNETIDLIDNSSTSMITNNSSTSQLVVPQHENKMIDASKPNLGQSNSVFPKILILNNFQKNEGKKEEESEFIIDEVTANLEEDLIIAVYNREPLWLLNKENQPDETFLESLWKEVAEDVGRSVLIVKEIWETLRNRFFKEQKIVEETKSTNWPYYYQLWFLKLNNFSAEEMAGNGNNEIISKVSIDNVIMTPAENSFDKSTSTNDYFGKNAADRSTANGSDTSSATVTLLSANNLATSPDVMFTATNSVSSSTNSIMQSTNKLSKDNLTSLTPKSKNVTAANVSTKSVATTNVSTKTASSITNVSTRLAASTTNVSKRSAATTTNVSTRKTNCTANSRNMKTIKYDEVIVLDDDEDAVEEVQLDEDQKITLQSLSFHPTSKSSQNSLLNKLLHDEDKDLAFLKRLLPRIKALSYGDRLRFQLDILSSLNKLENK